MKRSARVKEDFPAQIVSLNAKLEVKTKHDQFSSPGRAAQPTKVSQDFFFTPHHPDIKGNLTKELSVNYVGTTKLKTRPSFQDF